MQDLIHMITTINNYTGTSLTVQWLRTPSNVGDTGLIPGWATKPVSHDY